MNRNDELIADQGESSGTANPYVAPTATSSRKPSSKLKLVSAIAVIAIAVLGISFMFASSTVEVAGQEDSLSVGEKEIIIHRGPPVERD